MTTVTAVGTTLAAALCWAATCLAEGTGVELTRNPEPRGETRIVFASDSAITALPLWDAPAVEDQRGRPEQLRRAVDDLADNGVDVLAQMVFMSVGVGFFWPEHPDHVHRSYSDIDQYGKDGIQPI